MTGNTCLAKKGKEVGGIVTLKDEQRVKIKMDDDNPSHR
jgi:hypothetical protein